VRDAGSALVVFVLAVAAAGKAWQLPLGTVTAPGAGFFPFLLAVALALVALAIAVRALRRPAPPSAGAGPPGRLKLIAVTIALFVYVALLERLGFVTSTFLLMLVLLRAVQTYRWPAAVGGSAAAAVLAHLLFRVWLGVRLPSGPWGF
jgi:hypothetical protein